MKVASIILLHFIFKSIQNKNKNTTILIHFFISFKKKNQFPLHFGGTISSVDPLH